MSLATSTYKISEPYRSVHAPLRNVEPSQCYGKIHSISYTSYHAKDSSISLPWASKTNNWFPPIYWRSNQFYILHNFRFFYNLSSSKGKDLYTTKMLLHCIDDTQNNLGKVSRTFEIQVSCDIFNVELLWSTCAWSWIYYPANWFILA